eukprot:TRINITY_DN1532_c0_g3_i1.p1 TRINITY_DN1532_c0_g3~~TRINITY_DN1532_c0_g3_i1.p1  ORF type:complete len:256 (-),score=32.39 TRINITY_DN1532_c0_g3_i1:140-907(-)
MTFLSTAEWCAVVVPVVLYWTFSGLLYFLSRMNFTSVNLHKISYDGRPQNKVSEKEVLVAVVTQHLLQMSLAAVLTSLMREGTKEGMEEWWLVVIKIVLGVIFMDTYQYWLHRLVHYNRFLYKHFHSVHHRLYCPYAFGALYNHPLEGLVLDTMGGGIPALLLNMHPWTSCVFFSLATLKTVDDHCGYAWPYDIFQIVFSNNAKYHDIHHWGQGKMYNFSQPFFTFWDKVMLTDFEEAVKRGEIKIDNSINSKNK